jgi:hypothetical protein
MTNEQQTERQVSQWTNRVCWAVIAVFVALKGLRLLQGEPVSSELTLSAPSLFGIAAVIAVIVLIFKSPRVLRSATMIESNEVRTVVLSFSFVFILMAAYYILRPVRDAMASDWSNTEISVLWNIQLVLSTLIVALYGYACSRVRFTLLVPVV